MIYLFICEFVARLDRVDANSGHLEKSKIECLGNDYLHQGATRVLDRHALVSSKNTDIVRKTCSSIQIKAENCGHFFPEVGSLEYVQDLLGQLFS